MPVVRVSVTSRYAVTHELTPEGELRIVPDQVITADVDGSRHYVPLGEVVTSDPLAWDVPEELREQWEAEQSGVAAAPAPPPRAPAPAPMPAPPPAPSPSPSPTSTYE